MSIQRITLAIDEKGLEILGDLVRSRFGLGSAGTIEGMLLSILDGVKAGKRTFLVAGTVCSLVVEATD